MGRSAKRQKGDHEPENDQLEAGFEAARPDMSEFDQRHESLRLSANRPIDLTSSPKPKHTYFEDPPISQTTSQPQPATSPKHEDEAVDLLKHLDQGDSPITGQGLEIWDWKGIPESPAAPERGASHFTGFGTAQKENDTLDSILEGRRSAYTPHQASEMEFGELVSDQKHSRLAKLLRMLSNPQSLSRLAKSNHLNLARKR
jgi:hypothetical protein